MPGTGPIGLDIIDSMLRNENVRTASAMAEDTGRDLRCVYPALTRLLKNGMVRRSHRAHYGGIMGSGSAEWTLTEKGRALWSRALAEGRVHPLDGEVPPEWYALRGRMRRNLKRGRGVHLSHDELAVYLAHVLEEQ